jgi:pyoverdine/dityrosine biosynthesis protein Dit1
VWETSSAAVDRKYSYVSYTRPDVTTSIEALIEATRTWRPPSGRIIPRFDFAGFLARHTDDLEPLEPSGRTPAERVLDVLLHPGHCRSPEEHVRGQPVVTEKVERSVAAGEPVRIAIPSFAGRPCSPLTHLRVQPDLSEAYAFVLLHRISLHVRAVYEPGVHFVIVLDGTTYNPFYGYTVEAEHQYPRDLRALIEALGVERSVSLVDLQDLVDERADEFEEVREQVLPEIEQHWDDPDNAFRDELVETMRLGTNTVALTAAAIQLLKWSEDEPGPELIRAMRDAVEERARATAFAYMVFLVTIRRMRLIETALGDDIVRGTVHPKVGQYSPLLVHPTTTVAPWHGVALIRRDGVLNTVYESKLYEHPERYRGVYLEGEYTPFFYEELPAD